MKHPLYASGDLFLPREVRQFLETYLIGNAHSVFYLSMWSFMHMLSGIVYSFVDRSYWNYFLLHTIWELWQLYIQMTPIHTLRGVVDIGTDTIMGLLGVWIGRRIARI